MSHHANRVRIPGADIPFPSSVTGQVFTRCAGRLTNRANVLFEATPADYRCALGGLPVGWRRRADKDKGANVARGPLADTRSGIWAAIRCGT